MFPGSAKDPAETPNQEPIQKLSMESYQSHGERPLNILECEFNVFIMTLQPD